MGLRDSQREYHIRREIGEVQLAGDDNGETIRWYDSCNLNLLVNN
jgi:hypothetical protein